ncbi:hypothetical protein BH09PSE2_BH09PSE2_06160 [soil metagenome]
MCKPPEDDVAKAIGKLHHAKVRLLQNLNWNMQFEEAWQAFNTAGDVRRTVAASPATNAAWVYEKAILDSQVVMITRCFDKLRGNALDSERMTFPVCLALLQSPGVLERLGDEAVAWNNGKGEANREAVNAHAARFIVGLTNLQAERDPDRLKALRDHRDENIAHELHRLEDRPKPQYRYLTEVGALARNLLEHLAMAAEGEVIFFRRGEARRSAEYLWAAVADAARRG